MKREKGRERRRRLCASRFLVRVRKNISDSLPLSLVLILNRALHSPKLTLHPRLARSRPHRRIATLSPLPSLHLRPQILPSQTQSGTYKPLYPLQYRLSPTSTGREPYSAVSSLFRQREVGGRTLLSTKGEEGGKDLLRTAQERVASLMALEAEDRRNCLAESDEVKNEGNEVLLEERR